MWREYPWDQLLRAIVKTWGVQGANAIRELLPMLPAQPLQAEPKRDVRVRLGEWSETFLLTALAKKRVKDRKKDGDQMFSI